MAGRKRSARPADTTGFEALEVRVERAVERLRTAADDRARLETEIANLREQRQQESLGDNQRRSGGLDATRRLTELVGALREAARELREDDDGRVPTGAPGA